MCIYIYIIYMPHLTTLGGVPRFYLLRREASQRPSRVNPSRLNSIWRSQHNKSHLPGSTALHSMASYPGQPKLCHVLRILPQTNIHVQPPVFLGLWAWFVPFFLLEGEIWDYKVYPPVQANRAGHVFSFQFQCW